MRLVGVLVTFVLLCGCIGSSSDTTTSTIKAVDTIQTTSTTQKSITTKSTISSSMTPTTASTLPQPTCFDKIKNQDESEIDCGGVCKACPIVLNTPIIDNIGDYWIFYEEKHGDIPAREDRNYSYKFTYTGKTEKGGKEYDEYYGIWVDINSSYIIEKSGDPWYIHYAIENNTLYLIRDVDGKSHGSTAITKFNPPKVVEQYPYKKGAKWNYLTKMTWNQRNMNIITLLVNYTKEVIDEERVTVHAGTFDTLKIKSLSQIIRHGEVIVQTTVTSWYSPETNSYVKSESFKEVIGPSDRYRVQTNMGDWYFYERNYSRELWNYSIE